MYVKSKNSSSRRLRGQYWVIKSGGAAKGHLRGKTGKVLGSAMWKEQG